MGVNPDKSSTVSAVIIIVAIVVLLVATTITMLGHRPKSTPEHPYNPYQTDEALKRQYSECASHAQAGFTCVMVPMLVSEKFAQEEGNK